MTPEDHTLSTLDAEAKLLGAVASLRSAMAHMVAASRAADEPDLLPALRADLALLAAKRREVLLLLVDVAAREARAYEIALQADLEESGDA